MFNVLLYRIALVFLNHLPHKLCYWLADRVADGQYLFSFRDRRAVRYNLTKVSGAKHVSGRQVRNVFRYFGRYLVDFFQMRRFLNEDYIRRHVRVEGWKHMEDVLRRERRGIVLTAHLGNWELGAAILRRLGVPLSVVALRHRHTWINDLFNAQRQRQGLGLIPVERAARECPKLLREQRFVAIVGDRDFYGRGIPTDFLGGKAMIPRGAAVFAWKTSAPIVPVFLRREGYHQWTLRVRRPIWPVEPKGQKEREIQQIVKAYLAVIEEEIRMDPTQWLIFREFDR